MAGVAAFCVMSVQLPALTVVLYIQCALHGKIAIANLKLMLALTRNNSSCSATAVRVYSKILTSASGNFALERRVHGGGC
jgi:hypothetical protein